ncbi:hypothetical protein [Streptomyces chiangmaiensis]|uniref:Uncharacterized protein n=1 Tax=Streptomyces chiangmaiensis TaxID=766497 RepID=A0ABU7FMR5_9ACTN|nr:hypothetical protein [Streptomyces chiangmaiensis]MED7824992.1 hypothetical protein [Streptomyces chiangmaiensis]
MQLTQLAALVRGQGLESGAGALEAGEVGDGKDSSPSLIQRGDS